MDDDWKASSPKPISVGLVPHKSFSHYKHFIIKTYGLTSRTPLASIVHDRFLSLFVQDHRVINERSLVELFSLLQKSKSLTFLSVEGRKRGRALLETESASKPFSSFIRGREGLLGRILADAPSLVEFRLFYPKVLTQKGQKLLLRGIKSCSQLKKLVLFQYCLYSAASIREDSELESFWQGLADSIQNLEALGIAGFQLSKMSAFFLARAFKSDKLKTLNFAIGGAMFSFIETMRNLERNPVIRTLRQENVLLNQLTWKHGANLVRYNCDRLVSYGVSVERVHGFSF